MLKLGLTGGIASGKSAVAAMLRDLGFEVIDADSLARELIEPGEIAYQEVLHEFGPSIIDAKSATSEIDRKKLAAIVFADRAKLDRLNAIVHPRVKESILRQLEEWACEGDVRVAFVEAALLVEAGYPKYLDGLVVTWCTPEQQLDRLRGRGMSEDEARNRIAAQLPVADKLKVATEKIDCSGSLDDTRRQVEAFAEKLRNRG
ncbi:MAG: dephospho-CoA kinase [Candidatus Acidiferrum sp.]|jgi:dephospho-CoA kinase